MNGATTELPVAAGTAVAVWENCWKKVLCLPALDLSDKALFAEAERLVRSCHARAGDEGTDWFRYELADGQLFVTEQLAVDPDDPDWQRISAVLAGACVGLERSPAPTEHDRPVMLETLIASIPGFCLILLASTAIM